MKNLYKKKQFIELRSKGYSYREIAKTLKISERSLYFWSKEFEPEIKFLKSVERENLLASLNLTEFHKFKILGQELKKIETALQEKDYTAQPLTHLLKWKYNIIQKLFDFPPQDAEIMNLYSYTSLMYDESKKQREEEYKQKIDSNKQNSETVKQNQES
jgi:transposase